MTSLSISLPEPMRQFVEDQIRAGSYGTTSEYLRALIRAEQEKQAKLDLLRREVQVGIDEADRGRFSKLTIAQIKARARKRFAAGRKA